MLPPETYNNEIGSQSTMCQVYTWCIRLITRAWKNRLYRLPSKKDYHVYISRSIYHYAYARAPYYTPAPYLFIYFLFILRRMGKIKLYRSSPHFHVFSYASCVDLTQLLSQPNASWRTPRESVYDVPGLYLVHTSHYSRLEKPTVPLAIQERLPRIYYT